MLCDVDNMNVYERALNTCCEPLSWKSTNMLMTNEDVQMIFTVRLFFNEIKTNFFFSSSTLGRLWGPNRYNNNTM